LQTSANDKVEVAISTFRAFAAMSNEHGPAHGFPVFDLTAWEFDLSFLDWTKAIHAQASQ
jgi:hypothetical protein